MQVTLLQYYGDKAYSFGGNCPGAPHAIRPGKLVFLKDRLSGALFLADTGATGALRPLLPLLCSPEGFNHIFTIVDHSSRGLEATPLASTDTEIISAAFNSSLVARLGGTDHLTFDCGPQFCTALWSELWQLWGIYHRLTTTYHPQANVMV